MRRIRTTEHGRSAMQLLVAARPEFADGILLNIPLDDQRRLARGMAALGAEGNASANGTGEHLSRVVT